MAADRLLVLLAKFVWAKAAAWLSAVIKEKAFTPKIFPKKAPIEDRALNIVPIKFKNTPVIITTGPIIAVNNNPNPKNFFIPVGILSRACVNLIT